jgi:hypothetical protein
MTGKRSHRIIDMTSTLARSLWRLTCVLFGGALLLTGSGCGGGLHKVQGVVTLDGKPLAAAGVQFLPIGGHGQPANGITESDGSFHVDTHAPDDGAQPGEYKVVISKYEVDPLMQAQKIDPSDPKSTARAYAAAAKVANKPKKYLVPAIYLHENTTPLRWKVPDDNNKTLELTSTAK